MARSRSTSCSGPARCSAMPTTAAPWPASTIAARARIPAAGSPARPATMRRARFSRTCAGGAGGGLKQLAGVWRAARLMGMIAAAGATPRALRRERSRMTAVKTIGLLASALIAGGSISSDAHGEAAQDFYRNKQVRLIVGHPVGNDHDIGGRLLAKYLGKHIPGRPNVIVQNMTAAASVAAANHVYGQAPRDGTVMGTFSRNFPSQAMMGQPN